ncbi:Alpha-galactosidase [Micromonospora sp. MW-13]|uniref:alpha-galactosidase n=1 Tax=Micromonospora sp. MW-13 TaxID=2094022 RepID=UPI000EEF8D0E|nr:alpha-galactosidase [Micromonospora sp. MW-13]RGC70278.1 Alpha-galactosidase [Micromonospora sp. MW-13]
MHEQTLAVYRLLDELRRRHPGVKIESSSSGGARVDLEILRRAARVWASDCNDALERFSVQRWTGLLRAHLYELAGDAPRAVTHYRAAADRTTSLPEQHYLRMRAARLAGPAG